MLWGLLTTYLKSKAGNFLCPWDLSPSGVFNGSCLAPWCCISPDSLELDTLSPSDHAVLSIAEYFNSPNVVPLQGFIMAVCGYEHVPLLTALLKGNLISASLFPNSS